jgi:hypothetical protein
LVSAAGVVLPVKEWTPMVLQIIMEVIAFKQNTELETTTHKMIWTIQKFPTLLEYGSSRTLYSDSWEIPASSSEQCSKWRLRCDIEDPFQEPLKKVCIALDLIDLGHHQTVKATIKLLAGNSEENTLKTGGGSYNQICCPILKAEISHEFLRESADILMPGGQLTVCVELQFFQPVNSVVTCRQTEPRSCPVKNWHEEMVDNYVDLGPGSNLLLVAGDGQLMCHKFPLAARHGCAPSSL